MSLRWSAPGGLYIVPRGWQREFLREFPEYRVRWSLKERMWQIEQQCGRGALAPVHISEAADDLIRARDGFWLVMSFQPGERMACPGVVDAVSGQRCGLTIPVPLRRAAETRCESCRAHGRDGRYMAAFWPFDEGLLEHLRRSDPLRDGIRRMRRAADAANARLLALADSVQRDAVTSLDAVDQRWLTGSIAASGMTRRRVDPYTFR